MDSALASGASVGLTAILAGLSHALDLTEGHPRGHAERACRIGQALAKVIGLNDEMRRDLVHATLLKDAGCSSNALRVYQLFGGPEHGVKRAVWERPATMNGSTGVAIISAFRAGSSAPPRVSWPSST